MKYITCEEGVKGKQMAEGERNGRVNGKEGREGAVREGTSYPILTYSPGIP